MISYENVKNWLQEKENKQKVVYGFCFVLVFVIGFGTGRFDSQYRTAGPQSQSNYTTSAAKSPGAQTPGKTGQGTAAVFVNAEAAASTTPGAVAAKQCLIKGNSSSKIYHLPGDAFYNILKSPQCFQTESQAQAAGYRKSGR